MPISFRGETKKRRKVREDVYVAELKRICDKAYVTLGNIMDDW